MTIDEYRPSLLFLNSVLAANDSFLYLNDSIVKLTQY